MSNTEELTVVNSSHCSHVRETATAKSDIQQLKADADQVKNKLLNSISKFREAAIQYEQRDHVNKEELKWYKDEM